MAAGSQQNKEVKTSNFREIELPGLQGIPAGTYNMCLVVASNGTVTLRLTEPIADGTLSTISTLTVKDGIITAKA